MKTHKKTKLLRLLGVSQALRESPYPKMFTMEVFAHRCGTPACALGHYVVRTDLQDRFTIINVNGGMTLYLDKKIPGNSEIGDYFGISDMQCIDLFGTRGCGEAQTPIEAAEFIENFVAKHI